jgi:15-cis-phytoene synthase
VTAAGDAFSHCEALVRAADKDRFLAALFAPAEKRAALHALYAFNIEIARIRELIHEPLAGEIRLQWWSDALAGAAAGSEAHPVAAALAKTIESYQLPVKLLDGLVAARRFDLYDDPMRTLADFNEYARATSSNLFALAARILAPAEVSTLGELADHAGLAYAIAGLLQAFPIHAARGQLFLPLEVLARHGAGPHDVAAGHNKPGLRAAFSELRGEARAHLAKARALAERLPPAVLPALLPAALVRPLLSRMERADDDPFRGVALPQWRRQWLLWRAARNPARIFA